jgi:hypothetical protein
MKTFDDIISEATQSRTVLQAKMLGLQPDGHGGYYKNNEFVAKTEKDIRGLPFLKFFNQNQKPGHDPDQVRTKNNQQPVGTQIRSEEVRERYINNEIYNVGDKVEVIESGLVGEIIRRGTNYLICVTEDNVMFKPWLTDIREWTEISGVPADQREVGTDSLTKYAMKMADVKNIKNFINKYKKRN